MQLQNYIANLSATAQQKERERGIDTNSGRKQQEGHQNQARESKSMSVLYAEKLPNELKDLFIRYGRELLRINPTFKRKYEGVGGEREFLAQFARQCHESGIGVIKQGMTPEQIQDKLLDAKSRLDSILRYCDAPENEWQSIGKILQQAKQMRSQELAMYESRKVVEDKMKARADHKRMIGFDVESYKNNGRDQIKKLKEMLKKG
jgi:hypothetical protein